MFNKEEIKIEEKINEPQINETRNLAEIIKEQTPDKPMYVQLALPVSILLAGLIISGTLLYTKDSVNNNLDPRAANIGAQTAPAPQGQVNLTLNSNDHVLGLTNAKITIIEYSDFQCPFCRTFWSQTFPQLKKEYIDTGKILFAYRHYPLDFHPQAMISAKASECASETGKFWQMHDKLFAEQEKQGSGTIQFTTADIKKWASQIGLSSGFNSCLDSDKYSEKIKSDTATGTQAGVSGTPTFFINNQKIVGAQPYASFKAAIDSALK